MQNKQRQEQEKRKPEEDSHHHESPNAKRKNERSSQDIRDIFNIMNRKEIPSIQEQDAPAQETLDELVNLEEIFKAHVAETRRLERETETETEK